MRVRYKLPTAAAILMVLALALTGAQSAARVPGNAAGTAPSWRPLPKPPIAGRLGASAAWTGTEMIVWGGITSPGLAGFPYPQADGAAYDPQARRWRTIARSPSGVLGGGSSASAWTGREMAVWVGNSPQGPAAAATFNPRKNAWRRLPSGPLGVREGSASVWTGSELLVFGGHTGGLARPTGAALDPIRRSWRRLPGLAAVGGLGVANGAVWDGREAFVSGGVSTGPVYRPRAILFAFNPRTERVRPIDLSKAPVQPSQRLLLFPIAWTRGELLLLIGAPSTSSSIEVLRYNPVTRRWRKGKTAPCAGPTQTAWVGDGVVAACGANAIEIYRPRTDRWQTIRTTGASPLATKRGSVIVRTGTQLIVWSGVVNRPGNPTPPDGASIKLKG